MNFASDNWAGAHPLIAQSLLDHSTSISKPYQGGDIDRQVENRFSEIFQREVAVFFVGTGTAANALAMVAASVPGGVAFCHEGAHLIADECGAAEYLTGGTRLCPVGGEAGRMDPAALEEQIARFSSGSVHSGQSCAVSITQATEAGTVYELDQIEAIAEICRRNDLSLHMDGARFANALVALQTSPAEMTWKRGVDLLSFGATKNGCWCAEALVVFDPAKARQLPFIRKRAGQLFSKSRFVALQLKAYLDNELWLDNARHANAMAARLAAILAGSDARFLWQPQANALFPLMSKQAAEKLSGAGAQFYDWPPARLWPRAREGRGHVPLRHELRDRICRDREAGRFAEVKCQQKGGAHRAAFPKIRSIDRIS